MLHMHFKKQGSYNNHMHLKKNKNHMTTIINLQVK
jgi:hypothetical protein